MSYAEYLNRLKINAPKVIDTQMRLLDASSFTWRTKMAATTVNRRTDHIINNVQDTSSMNPKASTAYKGTGFGGKVQDASSYTQSLGAMSLGRDVFTSGRIQTVPKNVAGTCLASTPASQVIGEQGNADGNTSGLNMGYSRINGASNQVGLCTSVFLPLTESQFVDIDPDIKTHKIGSQGNSAWSGADGTTPGGQNPIICRNTNTSGNVKNDDGTLVVKDETAHMLFSEPATSLAKALFITSPTGSQVGGGTTPGSRAPKVGAATPLAKRMITHRGNPYNQPDTNNASGLPPATGGGGGVPTGTVVTTLIGLTAPRFIALNSNNVIYISDSRTDYSIYFTTFSSAAFNTIFTYRINTGALTGLAVSLDTGIVVASTADTITRYGPTGNVITSYSSYSVHAITSAAIGTIYFSDAGVIRRINIFSGDVTQVVDTGIAGPIGANEYINSMSLSSDNETIAYSTSDGRVFTLNTTTLATSSIVSPTNAPAYVAFDRISSRLYVADSSNQRIVLYNYLGALVGTVFTATGTPSGIAVDSNGIVFVTESNDDIVEAFIPN